jgi:hypothetical protein
VIGVTWVHGDEAPTHDPMNMTSTRSDAQPNGAHPVIVSTIYMVAAG